MGTRQLLEAGYSREAIWREVVAGRLHRLHQGVYAVGHTAVSRQGRCIAAVIACGDGALLSHGSAAWLWGLSTRYLRVVEVTGVAPRRHQLGVRVHSAVTLREQDRGVVEQIPVTSVPRTLLDLAAFSRYQPAPALERAKRLGLLDLMEIEDLLRRSRGQRGVRRLRNALEDFRDPAFTRSGVEERFLRLVGDAGLPRPSTNLFIEGYELDAYWADLRFAVELDTYDYHGDRKAFESDRVRQEDLKLSGIEMTRITGRRIEREPVSVANRLRQLLNQRRLDLDRRP